MPKLVIVGAPHTSNWDFIVFLGALDHYKVRMRYIGKHTLFKWPLGYVFRGWGGIPVDRTKSTGLVSQVADVMNRADRMILAMAPEGTRKAAPFWKGGFLSIAQKAGAQILLAYIDFATKRAGMGPTLDPADPGAVMDAARRFYAGARGRHPKGEGPVRLRTETGAQPR